MRNEPSKSFELFFVAFTEEIVYVQTLPSYPEQSILRLGYLCSAGFATLHKLAGMLPSRSCYFIPYSIVHLHLYIRIRIMYICISYNQNVCVDDRY